MAKVFAILAEDPGAGVRAAAGAALADGSPGALHRFLAVGFIEVLHEDDIADVFRLRHVGGPYVRAARGTGGPALGQTADGVEIVAVNSRSRQSGCLGSDLDETRKGDVETRVDDVIDWISDNAWRTRNGIWSDIAIS